MINEREAPASSRRDPKDERQRTRSLKERFRVNAKMANVTVEPKSEYTSETVNDTILYIEGGMQGPYTVCKELPTKGASNAARTPNIEGRLKGERKAGPSAALGIPPSTLPGGLGNTPPGATTLRWEIGLRNLYARRSLRDRRRR